MPGPEQDLPGEIVLVDLNPAPGQPSKGPRIFRYDGDPNVPAFVREPSTLVLDMVNNLVWQSNGDGTWTALGAGVGLAQDDLVRAQSSGVVILDIPSGNTPLIFPVLEKIEVIDLYVIKADDTGGLTDGVDVLRDNPVERLGGPFQVDGPVGTVYRVLQLGANRVLDIGDSITVTRGAPLVANNAVQLILSVIRRA